MKSAHFDQANIKVGQAAKLLGVSVDTLRRWESQGKLVPMRTPGSTRMYSLAQLSEINKNLAPQNLRSRVSHHLRYLNVSQLFLGRFLIFITLVLTGGAVILIAYLSLPTQSDFLTNFPLKEAFIKNLATDDKQAIALTSHELENSLPNAGALPEVVSEDEMSVDSDSLNKSTFSAGDNFEEVAKSGWTISPEDCLKKLFESGGI